MNSFDHNKLIRSSSTSSNAFHQFNCEPLKSHLCPKCNQCYNVFMRNHEYIGKVPLVLKCYHTMCEECLTSTASNHQVECCVCDQVSLIDYHEKRTLQEIFPVNFYILGLIHYYKPNLKHSTALKLKPAGVRYSEYTNSNVSNSSVVSDINELLKSPVQEKCCQTSCKKLANVQCVECDELYCTLCCETLHKTARGLKTHKIISINDFAPRLTTKCSLHKDFYLEVFCNTCKKISCCHCIVQEHKGHDFYELTNLNVLGDFNLEKLLGKAEEKLKRLMFAYKRATEESTHAFDNTSSSQAEVVIGKSFSHIHAKLQVLEKKLIDDVEQLKDENVKTLNNIIRDLSLNVCKLNSLINSLKNANSLNSDSKYDVRAIIESLEIALSLPCYFIGEPQNINNIEFTYQDLLNKLDEYFTINFKTNNNQYRLVQENELPNSYNTTLPNASMSDLSAFMDSFSSLSTKSLSSQTSNSTNPIPNKEDFNMKSSNIKGWIKSTQNKMPSIGDRESVIVSHIDSPESFYVQLNRLENAFQDLCVEVQYYAQTFSLPVTNVEINKLYIVKYEVNNFDFKWYRGRVIDIKPRPNGNVYTVLFIDYGNISIVSASSILNISSELSQYPPFAHKCKLFQIYPVGSTWDSKARIHMAKIINESNVVMVIMKQTNGILEVDLLSVSNVQTTSIRDALIFIGLALTSLDSPSHSLRSAKNKPYVKLHARNETLKNGDTLMVVICNVINPYSLYVQAADFVYHLDRLTNSMTNYYNQKTDKLHHTHIRNEHIYVPKRGMVVAVHVDSTWSRATVIKVVKGEGTVTVFLEDYGRTVTVDYTRIRKLPERFRKLECQAIHVKLADVKPKFQTWDIKATQYLHQYLENKKVLRLVVVNAEKVHSVALYECYSTMDVSINNALVEEGLAISTGGMFKSAPYLLDEQTQPTKEKNYVFDLISTIQCTKSNEDNNSDSEQENVIRKPVKVLSVKSPDEIFVEIEDPVVQKMQYELHQSLQNYYSNQKTESKKWEANDPCVAYNPENKQFFRGIILERSCENYKVMLRDVAEEIVVSEQNIYVLQNQFKQFREKAVRCHLANIIPAGDKNKWSGLAIDFLQKVFEKHTKILMTKNGAVDRIRKSIPVVMWYYETKHEGPLEPSKTALCSINKLLVKNGLAFKDKSQINKFSEQSDVHHVSSQPTSFVQDLPDKDGVMAVRPTSSETSGTTFENRSFVGSSNKASCDNEQNENLLIRSSSLFPKTSTNDSEVHNPNDELDKEHNTDEQITDWLPPLPLKSKNFLAVATFVDYNACIYIHESSKESVLKTMEDEMKKYFGNTSPEPMDAVWVPGQLCTVKYFVNDNWYRGKILSVGEDCITVFLIDYGNEEECKHEDLRLKVMYLDLPAFAQKIQLDGVYPKSSLKWLTSDLDELHRKIVENQIHVSIKKRVPQGMPIPAIVKLNGENINEYMKDYSSNLTTSIKKNWSSDCYESDEDVIIENEKSFSIAAESEPNAVDDTYIQNSLPAKLVGQTINVTVISVINYNEFVLEILINQNIKETKRLFDKISKDVCENAEQQPLLKELKVGKSCIAKFSEDGKWYRGEIVDIKNIDIGMAHIWFVDYGNSENVSKEFIRCLHPNWLELPILQYKAKLDGVALADPSCLDLVLDCMTDYCNTLTLAEIVSVNPLRVKLYDDSNQLIYQDLIDQQLLIKVD